MDLSSRKNNIKNHFDLLADRRNSWINRNKYFYKENEKYVQFLIGENKRVLELGCGTGQLLNALKDIIKK